MASRSGSSPHFAPPIRVLLLVLADSLVLFLAGLAAYHLWAKPVHQQPASLYLQLLLLLPLFLLGYADAGLYPGFGLGSVEVLRRFSLRTSFTFLVLAGITFAYKLPHLFSRMTLLIAWLLALAALPVCRVLVATLLRHRRWWAEPIVVVGTGPRVVQFLGDIESAALLGYRPVAILASPGSTLAAETEGLRVFDQPGAVRRLAEEGIRTALLVPEESEPVGELVDSLQPHFRRVVMVHGTSAFPVEGVQVRNLGRALGIEFSNHSLRPWNRLLKRTLDLTLGGILFLLILPVLALAALAIKLTSRGPVLFRQEREGFAGAPLRVLKLRTMVEGAERHLEASLADDEAAQEQWRQRFKLSEDPRVIPVIGTFLRRSGLDEAPQLWQVLKGEMSLVGPRPFPDYHLREFPPDFRALRRQVRPGLTGLWQVMARSDADLADQQRYDSYYIRNWSVWMDLHILTTTLGAVLRGRGA